MREEEGGRRRGRRRSTDGERARRCSKKTRTPHNNVGNKNPHTTMHDRNKLPESTVGVFESLGLGGRRTCIAMCFCIMQHRNHTLVCRAIECMHSIAEIFPTPNTVGLKR